ncbi:MAG: carbohydrate ABC transporter permease [Candidatus Dormibacteraceae bacterium]
MATLSVAAAERRSWTSRLTGGWLDRQGVLGYVLLTPALVLLLIFLAYPFVYGVWLAMTDAQIGAPTKFVGLGNFVYLFTSDPVYHQTLINTFEYTFVTVVIKFFLGLMMAAVLNLGFRFNRIVRAAMLLPYIVPTVMSTLAWLWMYNSTYSVINWILLHGLGVQGPIWLSTNPWPMISLMIVNIWRGVPFFGVLLLAAMQSVPNDLHEAGHVDGANAFQRWLFITIPTIRPVILITTLLTIISTFSDFQVIWVLTQGGPVNSTQVLGTYAFSTGIVGTSVGLGASIALTMFPLLVIMTGVVLWLLRRD